ncbi:alpha/beta hydrolase family protein [Kitasatospora purpeofusca]|uniref:alpha/beta hydrolase family protein n=1 Tax=Kitasatospora purpeofusca TaxID=67352 RepID=UPI0004BF4218|nr:alpha/beta hydrolase [Kitasatospora purpeofusca]
MSKTARWRSAALPIASTALVLALAGPAAASAPAAATATTTATTATDAAADSKPDAAGPRVPATSTHRPVGTTSARLVDRDRPDPWRPDTPSRELMVTFWYPTDSARGAHAPYLSPELSTALYGTDAPAGVRTGAVAGARPAPGRHPLVLLSPGFGLSRTTLTALGEELAARGYAVAAVDHTYETLVEFPGGRIEPCLVCGREGTDPDFGATASRARAADLRFVIDRLTAPGGRGPVRGLAVDPGRIAAAGHSLGGAAALEAMGEDRRIRAAANLDGTVWIPPTGLRSRPVLLFSAQLGGSPGATGNWEDSWKRLTGPRYWVDLPTAGHLSFSDEHWVVDALGSRDQLPADSGPDLFGTVRGERALAATRAYLGAFLDRHLLGRPAPLLDRPSRAFPEVRFAK